MIQDLPLAGYEQESQAIQDCVTVCEGDDLVVAVVFAPLFGRSARLSAMQRIAARYASDRTVYVTCDLDLYRKVQKGDVGTLRQTILSRHSGVVLYPDIQKGAVQDSPD